MIKIVITKSIRHKFGVLFESNIDHLIKNGSQAISYSFPGYYETPTSCGKAMRGKNNNKYGRQAEVGV